MYWCPEVNHGRCHRIYGVWRCFAAYQGTMPARSWIDAQIVVTSGVLTIVMADTSQGRTHRCQVQELGCAIDIFPAEGSDEEELAMDRKVWRGVFQLDRAIQLAPVLVACWNQAPAGPRPLGPPEGLPTAEEAASEEYERISSKNSTGQSARKDICRGRNEQRRWYSS